ncbi:hypothetical protein GNI_081770 [Gregarina niphandrodes]|uniref:Uncharacterized protein n=1 Tax=Gregarina niphandrodes TaxID=110365 RepID=A0A023B697_GRENI|nr:hypothetical protein GNI_081770 [Gregarina niphandrodes]EZG65876.1 hypothetical protein GNI_081770 [Gregarina niphandrodes]|eukprot:XP_011134034.1 hypothetical protein GNI_081770 [Gregarina niphandrodes]
MQTPTNLTHGLYTPEFMNAHAVALGNILDPDCSAVLISEEQQKQIGPRPENTFLHPWSRIHHFKKDLDQHNQASQDLGLGGSDGLRGSGGLGGSSGLGGSNGLGGSAQVTQTVLQA